MAAYNEQATIRKTVEGVLSLSALLELIIVDDASSDDTPTIAKELAGADPRITYLRQPNNLGKTAAVKRGVEITSGSVVIGQDADLEYDPSDIPRVIAPIVAGRADVVYGSRFSSEKAGPSMYMSHNLANRAITTVSNWLSGLKLGDVQTCYIGFRGELIRDMVITSKRFGLEIEATAKVAKSGVRVSEVPISYTPRPYHEGKKIGWKDGVAAIWYIAKYNLLVSRERSFRSDRSPLVNSEEPTT